MRVLITRAWQDRVYGRFLPPSGETCTLPMAHHHQSLENKYSEYNRSGLGFLYPQPVTRLRRRLRYRIHMPRHGAAVPRVYA